MLYPFVCNTFVTLTMLSYEHKSNEGRFIMKKKVLALALAFVMILSLFPVTAMASAPTQQIFWGFEEVNSVDQMEIGENYIFFTEKYDTDSVVTGLPEGSAILNFGGTDYTQTDNFAISPFILKGYYDHYPEEALQDEAAWDAFIDAEMMNYDEFRVMAAEWFEDDNDRAPTEAELDSYLWMIFAESIYYELYYPNDPNYELEDTFMSFDSLDDYNAWAANYSSDPILFESLEEICDYMNSLSFYTSADIKAKYGKATWEENLDAYFAEFAQDYHKEEILEGFDNNGYCSQDDRDGYVTVIQAGPGFDSCYYGTIAYIDYEYDSYNDRAWYYGCNWGGVCYVGPFYAYTYNEGEFNAEDISAFYKPGKEPTSAKTVTLDDVDVTVNVNGANVSVGEGFVQFIDATVDPTQNDNSITLSVGGIQKTIGEIGAPPAIYSVTVNNGSGDGSFAAGRMVVITADAPADGMMFDRWTGNVTFADATATTTSFVMPEGNVTVTATYRAEGSAPTPPSTTDKIIDTINLTVDWGKVPELVVGQSAPGFTSSDPNGGDYVVVTCEGVSGYAYGWLRERTEEEYSPLTKWTSFGPDDVIADDVEYALGVEFPLDEGYVFADTVTVKINGGLVANIDYVEQGDASRPTMMGITIALGTLEDIEDAKDNSTAHSHEITKIEAKEPTYTTEGNKEYYYCESCDTCFADAEGKAVLTEAEIKALVIPSLTKEDEDKDTPVTPSTPATPNSPVTPSTPVTGDINHVAIYVLMSVISAAAIVLLIGNKKKFIKENN